jgi:hypothetical protein
MVILEIVKKSLLIPLEESFADEELESYINSCKELLVSAGVDEVTVNGETDPIVESLIIIYCKTFFGFKSDGSVKELPKSFHMLLNQLALTKEVINVS